VTQLPPSYATADEARAYVARVLSRRVPKSPEGNPRLYLIAPAGSPKSPPWPNLLKVARAKFPRAELADYHEVWPARNDGGVDARVERIAAEFSGALVLCRQFTVSSGEILHLLGYAARQEADKLAALGVPVLVLAPSGIVTWADCRAWANPDPPPWLPITVDMPEVPEGRTLPTVAASYRALGIAPPGPRPARKAAR
jgi:hypothetical protein